MDLLQGVKDLDQEVEAEKIRNMNPEDMPLPSIPDMLKALEGLSGISDEDKQTLREQLLSQGGLAPPAQSHQMGHQFFVLFGLLLVLAVVFVFFGYKLYKSLTEKERKRDEKRKMKQMKKRK